MCLFSFVVPVYNVKKEFLKKCLDSILYINLDSIEIIIVDDNSTNGCEIVCDEYQSKDARVKTFHFKNNAGVSNARNFGVKRCSGEWIVFVDSDDWVDANICDRLMRQMHENYDVIMFSAYRESLNNTGLFGTSDTDLVYKEGVLEGDELSIGELSVKILAQPLKTTHPRYDTIKYCWGKAIKKEFLINNNIQFEELNYCEDILFMDLVFRHAKRVLQIPDRMYHYRVNGASTVNSYREDALSEQKKFLEILNNQVGTRENDTMFFASLLSMQICITRFLYNKKNKKSLINKHAVAKKFFSDWPYSDVFNHIDCNNMKRKDKWKARLLKSRLYYLYYLTTEVFKLKSKRFN